MCVCVCVRVRGPWCMCQVRSGKRQTQILVLAIAKNLSLKTAEPKMAFNFAHLLSAACGGAPHRLRRLRRPCALGALSARPCCGFWASWGAGSARFVPDFDVSGKTAEPKMAFNFAHLLSAACGGAPRRLGRLRRPCGSVCRWRYTAPVRHTATLWRAGAGGGARLRSRGFYKRESGFCVYENGRP